MILLLNITVFLDFESTGNKLLLFTIQIEVLVVLQINMIKLSVNKTKWPGLSDRTRAFILQILINIKFRARKVTRTFENRAPGLLQ